MKTIHKKHDHIKVKGKYYQCICADSDTAVFAPLVKKNDCLSAKYTNMFAVPNHPKHDDFEYDPAKLIQWTGTGLKSSGIPVVNNPLLTEITEDRTLKIRTANGVVSFKKGQYINYINKEVFKP